MGDSAGYDPDSEIAQVAPRGTGYVTPGFAEGLDDFGATEELGLFEMTAQGLIGVPDASKLLLVDRRSAVPGSVVVPAMDGRRPLLVEVQALTVPVPFAAPARRNA